MKVLGATLLVLISYCLHSQEDSIEDWQQVHPNILFFEAQDFALLSSDQQSKLGENIIVFDTKITWKDITSFELRTMPSDSEMRAKNPDSYIGSTVKFWLADHPEVKIIPRSYYDALDVDQQAVYQNTNALILDGEHITLEDIQRYEEIH